jgi:hypothetical protein
LAGACARPPTGTLLGSAPVPVAVFGIAASRRPQRRQARHICRTQTKTIFSPVGAAYSVRPPAR